MLTSSLYKFSDYFPEQINLQEIFSTQALYTNIVFILVSGQYETTLGMRLWILKWTFNPSSEKNVELITFHPIADCKN